MLPPVLCVDTGTCWGWARAWEPASPRYRLALAFGRQGQGASFVVVGASWDGTCSVLGFGLCGESSLTAAGPTCLVLLGAAPLLGSRFWEGLSWSQVSESHSGLSASAFLLITASGHICAHRARWPLGRRITHAESTEGEEDGHLCLQGRSGTTSWRRGHLKGTLWDKSPGGGGCG